jgi:hypothetical protein
LSSQVYENVPIFSKLMEQQNYAEASPVVLQNGYGVGFVTRKE